MKETEILTAQTSSFLGPQFILLIGFVAVMYFLIIRPQNKKMKAQQEMIDSLAIGDEIISSGGLVCTISKISDDFLTVRANDVQFILQRNAINSVLPKGTINSI
jgi:preprotein translocase subunit YajC|tara:strand:- start:932 stop:1243 length:312 start_codon:yes stop_codon:yes gene_type:complete